MSSGMFSFWEPILKIGVHRLQNRKVRAIVIPDRPIHQVLNPLLVNWSKLAVDLPYQITMPALSKINPASQQLCGFVKREVRSFWR